MEPVNSSSKGNSKTPESSMNPTEACGWRADATKRGSPHGNIGIIIYCILQMARVLSEKS
jgi:hypothetical protein